MTNNKLKKLIEEFAKDNNIEHNPQAKKTLYAFAIWLGFHKQ